MKIKLFLCISVVLLISNNVLASCPACLGTVGLPIRGPFLTSLTHLDLDIVYQETLEMKDEFWRKIRLLNISASYNIPNSSLSFGTTLPFSFAEGFMADGEYHRVTGITGIDLFTRYFLFKSLFSSDHPILMAIFGTRLPIGTISHLEHPDVKVPHGLLAGMGGSIVISSPLVFYGNTTYLFNFKSSSQYTLGDKFSGVIGANTSLDVGLPLMLGVDVQFISNFSDNDPHDTDVAKNTNRQVISIGPKLTVLIINEPKLSLDAMLSIPVFENRSGTKQLPTSTISEFGLGVGF